GRPWSSPDRLAACPPGTQRVVRSPAGRRPGRREAIPRRRTGHRAPARGDPFRPEIRSVSPADAAGEGILERADRLPRRPGPSPAVAGAGRRAVPRPPAGRPAAVPRCPGPDIPELRRRPVADVLRPPR